jgi:8-oxo-dGTP pyrophosphatase MutT (NUDIX family)
MERLEDSLKYRQWRSTLEANQIQLHHVEELSVTRKPNGEILFAKLKVHATNPKGEKLLPIVLLRGHFVSVLTCLTSAETGKQYLLLVKQHRIANGAVSYEHPAGMCDSETDALAVAVKEVKEETGLAILPSQLTQMNEDLLFTSAGLLDEGGYFFSCELTLPDAEIDQFRDRKSGETSENEHINTFICPIEEALPLMNSVVSQLSVFLYWRSKGKI